MYMRSSKVRRNNRIVAAEEAEDQVQDQEKASVNVAPEATELVFETSDVAELIAEVTGNDVEVSADENEITFTVGETNYTVEAEGDEEVLEASTSVRGRRAIRASRRSGSRRITASSGPYYWMVKYTDIQNRQHKIAFLSDEHDYDYAEQEMDDYIPEPYTSARLLGHIEEHLAGQLTRDGFKIMNSSRIRNRSNITASRRNRVVRRLPR